MSKLPKSLIRKYGISKKAWAVFRSQRASSPSRKSVKTMAKKKRSYGRFRRARRRFSKAKVPFEVLIAGGLIPFTASESSGQNTIMRNIETSDWQGIANNLKSGFLGMDMRGNIDPMRLLNPFDMDRGRYTKMLLYAGLIGMVRRKITGKYTSPLFKKIPIIGRFVS